MPHGDVSLRVFRRNWLPGNSTRWQTPGGERLECTAPLTIKGTSWQSFLASGAVQRELQRLALVQPMTGAARGFAARLTRAMATETC